MIALRPYQAEAVDSIYHYFGKNTGNPLIVLPTGTGKSICIAEFIRRAIRDYSDTRILCITHVRELIAQNYAQLIRLWPDAPAGVYSAGLNRRDLHQQVLFCGVQSTYKRAADIQRADLVLIDEAHLIGRNDAGMYRRFIKELTDINPWLKVVGLTATAYRLDSGYLHKGDGALFDAIAYEANLGDMVEQGYLSPLTTKRTKTTLDVTGVKVRGGEFVAGDLERAVNVQDINEAIAAEIIEKGADRGSWLVFAAGVDHAKALCALLPDAACVFGETPVAERDQIIGDFKCGRLRALVNVGVLTTGFDAPGVDLIAMCRPTKSTGLYVQQLGRGTRLAEGKENCILEGQRVLTDHGLVPIENVTTKMKVWDGVCFVLHDGVVFMGEQEVVTYAGLTATADHKVWTAEGWSSFGECATKQTPISVTGDGRKTIRQIEGHFRRDSSEERKGSSTHISRMRRLFCEIVAGLHKFNEWYGRMPEMWKSTPSSKVVSITSYFCKAEMHKPKRSSFRKIWSAWIRFIFSSPTAMAVWVQENLGLHPDMEIDRINNEGHYEAGNLRWSTRSENQCNTRGIRSTAMMHKFRQDYPCIKYSDATICRLFAEGKTADEIVDRYNRQSCKPKGVYGTYSIPDPYIASLSKDC